MRNKNGYKNQVIALLERPEPLSSQVDEEDIFDKFSDEAMMRLATIATLFYVDFANYLVFGIIPNISNSH